MKCLLSLALLFLLCQPASAQSELSLKPIALKLGDTPITINVYEKAGLKVTLVVLHGDEVTGLELCKKFVGDNGGRLIELFNPDKRYVGFETGGVKYDIDPNRIFTDKFHYGLKKNLKLPSDAASAAKKFGMDLLEIILPQGKLPAGEKVLVAVHNNMDNETNPGTLSIETYQKKGSAAVVARTRTFDSEDIDNFFLVTQSPHLDFFARRRFNVAIQPYPVPQTINDGSLSIYCGQRQIPYVIVEAEDGKSAEQQKMLDAVRDLIRSMN